MGLDMAGQEKPTIKHCKHLLFNLNWTLGLWYILQVLDVCIIIAQVVAKRLSFKGKCIIILHITLPFQATLKSANI